MQSNKTQNVTAGAVRFPLLLRLNQCRRQIVRWNVIKLGHCERWEAKQSPSLSPPLRDLRDWLNHISRDTGTVSSIPIYLSFLKYSRNSCRFLNTQCLDIFWKENIPPGESLTDSQSSLCMFDMTEHFSSAESELSGQRCHSYFISSQLTGRRERGENILQRKHEKCI